MDKNRQYKLALEARRRGEMGDAADAIIEDGIAVECGLDPDHAPGERRSEEAKRDLGIEIAAAAADDLLIRAREYAHELAQRGCITIDDVRRELERVARTIPPRAGIYMPGNWMGAVFKAGAWVRCGYRRSTHEGGHARVVSVWRLKGRPCVCGQAK